MTPDYERAVSLAEQAFKTEAESILLTLAAQNRQAFARAVEILALAPRIAASACGHSGIACRHFAHLMCCIERPARFISPSEALHGAMGFLQKGDCLLLASRGGRTAELLPIADIASVRGVSIIAVTENAESELAQKADVVLPLAVTRETDRDNCQGTTSFAVTNALFDALQAAIIEITDFKSASFGKIHPNGAVGERLNRSTDGKD